MISVETVLQQCGVTNATLSQTEKDQLDQVGYVLLADVIDPDWLARLRNSFETGDEKYEKQSGTRHPSHLADLIRKDAAFNGVYTHTKLLAAVHHILRREFRLFAMAGRDPLPGYGQQGLHTDWMFRAPHEPNYAATALWLLDDFTATNGATRLIPGSHLWERPLPKAMQQPTANHPQQQTIIAKAGSVLIFNGHLYHSGTRNDSRLSRRVLQLTFVAREVARFAETTENLPDRLTPIARYLLGA